MNRPEQQKNFRVWENGTNISYGMATVQLPSMEALSNEVKGAGLLGSYNAPVVGHYGPLTATFNFYASSPAIKACFAGQPKRFDLRVAEQMKDDSTGNKTVNAVKYLIGGTITKLDLGAVEGGASADGSIDLDVTLFAIYEGGRELQYFDKTNYIYRVNGNDILAAERAALGV